MSWVGFRATTDEYIAVVTDAHVVRFDRHPHVTATGRLTFRIDLVFNHDIFGPDRNFDSMCRGVKLGWSQVATG